MKKHLLKLVLVSCLLFLGFTSANAAAAVTVTAATIGTAGTNGLAVDPISSVQSGIAIYGFSLSGNNANGASQVYSSFNFSTSGSGGSISAYFSGTISLYSSNTNSTYPGGTPTFITSVPVPASNTLSIPFSLATQQTIGKNANLYYFIVVNYTSPVNATFGLNFTSATAATGSTTLNSTQNGYVYTLSNLLFTPLTTPGSNGLATSTLYTNQTNLPIYGFSLSNTGTTVSPTITALSFNNGITVGNNNAYYTNMSLYSSTSSTFNGISDPASTLIKMIAGSGNATENFTTLNISVPAGQTIYYFLVISNILNPNPNYEIDYASVTGPKFPAVSTANQGYDYALSVPPNATYAVSSLGVTAGPTNGLAVNPINTLQSNIAVYGLQVTGSGATYSIAQTLSALQFTENASSTFQNLSLNFANFRLYSSTSSIFLGTGNAASTLLSTQAAPTANTITFSGLTQSVAYNSTLYYFVVVDYTTPVSAAATFELDFTKATGSASNVTTAATGFNYTLPSLTVTASSLNTATNPAQPTAGLTPNPISSLGTGLPVYGLQLTASGTAPAKTITAFNFTQAGGQNNNYYVANAYLYSSTTPTYSTATRTLLQTITGVGAATTLNFTGLNISVASGQTLYYFILIDYNTAVAAAATFQLNLTSATGATLAGTPTNGYSYNFSSITITATALGVSGGPLNGLTPNPIATTASGLPIYGLQLTATTPGPTKTITALNFTSNSPQGGNNYYFSKEYLYSSTSSTFPGVGNAGATLVSTVNTDGTDNVSFTSLNIPVAAGATLYYFVVVDYTAYIAAATSTYQLNFTSAGGPTIASGTGNTGFNYTVTSPTFTFAANTAGVTPGPYYYGGIGEVLNGFSVTATTASTLTSFTLTSTTAYTTYFGTNLAVLVSTNSNYLAALAASQLTSVSYTTSGTTSLTFTLTSGQAIGTTPLYFYILADFSNGDNLLPATFQFNGTAATATSSGSAITLTNTASVNGLSYNLISPIVLGTATQTGLATANQLNYNQTGVGVLGFSVITSGLAETVTTLDFSAAISSLGSNIGSFFSNVKLYVSTTNNFSAATPVAAGYTVSSLTSASNTFTISGLSQTVQANSTAYYFIVADFTAPTNFSSTIAFSCTDAINTASTTFNDGAPITGITYTCGPSVTLAAASTTGLAANPITGSATGIGIFGFSITSGPANTFTQFNLNSTQPTGFTIGSNFAGFQLYVSNSNSFAAANPVGGATFSALTSTTLTITGLSQTITGTTKYYFIVANYTAPAIATTFALNLASVATSSTTYTTGGPVNGTNYTLTGKAGVYYWTGQNGNAWENGKNWLNAYYNATNKGYPSQTLNTDIAVFSPVYATGTNLAIITSSEVISQIIVVSGNNSPYKLQIQNGLTFGVTNGLTLGDAGQAAPYSSQLQLAESTNPGGTGVFQIGGTSSLYNLGSLAVSATTTFTSGSIFNLYGVTGSAAFIGTYQYGAITANNTTFNLSGSAAEIYGGAGTFTAHASNFTFGGFSSQLSSFGAAMTVNGCTLNATSTSSTIYITGVGVNSGSFTADSTSVINLGTSSSNGAYTMITANGGTFNLNGSSTVNVIGTNAFVSNNYHNPQTPSVFNVNASTINLGTSAGTDGSYAGLFNSFEGVFNLNAGSVINMNGANSQLVNTSYTSSGTTYYGEFNAASTSVINPISTTATISNANASNYFTLLSDINGSATIGQLGSGAKITGQYNVQRYLNGGATYLRNYRLLSSPINRTSATSSASNHIDLSYVGQTTTIPSYTGTAATFYGAFIGGPDPSFGGGVHTFANPLMYLYQENIVPGTSYKATFTSGKNVGVVSLNSSTSTIGTLNTAAGYGSGSSSTSPSVASTSISRPAYDSGTGILVPPGNGYITFYVDNSQDATPSAANAPVSSTVTASGYINQAQVQLYMWGSDSPNLTDTYGLTGVRLPGITVIGNPYPSTIDLQHVWADNSNAISTSLYQLDKTNQQFDTYNASTQSSSTSLSSEYVASGQGFYIHVDSTGNNKNFYFQEDQKTTSTNAAFFPPISNFAVIHNPGQTENSDNGGVSHSKLNIDGMTNAAGLSGSTGINDAIQMQPTNVSMARSVVNTADTSKANSLTPLRAVLMTWDKKPAFIPPVSTVKPESPQPKQTLRNIPVVHKPAGLHLKFVVDSVNYDEVGVYYNAAWSDKYDANDSFDLDGQSGKVFLSSYTSDGIRTSVNALGDYTGGKRVKLFVKATTTGIFQVQMSDIANLDTAAYSVFLLDNLKKDSLDLTLYKSYNFNYTPATANDSTRFVLAIEHKPVPYYALLTFGGQKVTPGVQLDWKTKNEGSKTTFVLQKLNANNVYSFLDSLQSDSSGYYSYVDQHPTLGNNTYRLQQTSALGKITFSAPVTIGYNSTSPNGGLTVYPNPSRNIITVTLSTSSIATTVATADIYNMSGILIEHKAVSSNSFTHDISAYKLGVYIIELKNSNGVLVGKSKFVKVQ